MFDQLVDRKGLVVIAINVAKLIHLGSNRPQRLGPWFRDQLNFITQCAQTPTDNFDKTCVVDFLVGTNGKPISVKIAKSTEVDELDKLALRAANQWRFKPATRDGEPIESRVRLHIEFQVGE